MMSARVGAGRVSCRRLIGSGAAVLAVGWVLACGDGAGPEVEGSFSGTVTGSLQRSLSGTAVFAVATIGGNEGFVIAMERGSSAQLDVDLVLLGRFNTSRPGPGTYNVVSGTCVDCSAADFDGGYVFQRPDGSSGFYVSESGSVTITTSTADTLAGSCDFIARSVSDPDATVTVSTTFTAVPGSVPEVPGG